MPVADVGETLHGIFHKSSAEVEVGSGARVGRNLESIGTTPTGADSKEKSDEWWDDLEHIWRVRVAPHVRRLDTRARRLKHEMVSLISEGDDARAVACGASALWASRRATAMAMARRDVIAQCGKRWRIMRCGCGYAEHRVGCDQPTLCEGCGKRHWRRWRKKLTRAFDAHLRAAVAKWGAERVGRRPGTYMITLTAPHTGDIEADRKAMGRAWSLLAKLARKHGWWGAYAASWEVTTGTRGDGHVHLHVAAISQWIPYEDLHAAWRSYMPGAKIVNVSAPRANRRGSAASYLAKYVTKGVQTANFTGAKAGELLVANRGKRKLTTSRSFFDPIRDRKHVCRACKCAHRLVMAPLALQAVAPGAVLKARAEVMGMWLARGSPQKVMSLW